MNAEAGNVVAEAAAQVFVQCTQILVMYYFYKHCLAKKRRNVFNLGTLIGIHHQFGSAAAFVFGQLLDDDADQAD